MTKGRSTIGVTVIGGYLGSGKTTLVNHLLRTADERLAVLVNDFGDVNIDADLITHHDGATMELANGCICCSLVDGFAAALDTIDGLAPRPERLVIEASGVADPATVAAYAHTPGLALDAVVVLVDVETVRERAADAYVGQTVLGQLVSADLLVVNKLDLVDGDTLADVERWLAELAPGAAHLRTVDAQVPPELLFGRSLAADRAAPTRRTAGHTQFESWSWSGTAPIERVAVEAAMTELPAAVLRLKGTLVIVGRDDPHVLQRAGRRWTLRADRHGQPITVSRVVAIGEPGAIDDGWLDQRLGPAR